eukprot:m.144142 g.144142  ORF g.144142 m.144142 type:complete len:58 (-) comp13219_c0_seq8:2243-2416(-)
MCTCACVMCDVSMSATFVAFFIPSSPCKRSHTFYYGWVCGQFILLSSLVGTFLAYWY